jgi:hypothetical protein
MKMDKFTLAKGSPCLDMAKVEVAGSGILMMRYREQINPVRVSKLECAQTISVLLPEELLKEFTYDQFGRKTVQ